MKSKIVALIVLLSVLAIVFFPVLFQGRVLLPLDYLNTMILPYSAQYRQAVAYNHFLCDAVMQYYPYKVLTRKGLSKGILNYWDQYVMGGYPRYAETMGAHFDITNIILLCASMPTAYHLQIILQLLIAGLGMFLLLRFYKVSEFIAILFSVVYMLNSMFITWLLHRWIVASFCWVPFIILMLCKYYDTKKTYFLILSSIFLAFSYLGGSFQTSVFVTFILFTFNASFFLFTVKDNSIGRLLKIPFIVFSVGFGLSAIMWFPSLEMYLLNICEKSYLGSAFYQNPFLKRILSLPLLLTFFIPELAGSVRAFSLSRIINISIFDFNGFVGFLPNLFGVWGAFFLWKRRLIIRPFIILMFLGLAIPLFTPLSKYLYFRFFMVFIFGLIIVGAVAFNTFIKDQSCRKDFGKWYKYVAMIFCLIVAGVVLLNICFSFYHEYSYTRATEYLKANIHHAQFVGGNAEWFFSRIVKTFEHFTITSPTMYLPFFCVSGVLIFLFYFLKGRLKAKIMLIGLGVITFIQLFIFSRSWLPMIDSDKYPLYAPTQELEFLRKDSDNYRVLVHYDRIVSQPIFPANILSMYKIADLSGYESIFPETIINLRSKGDYGSRLLGLLNVKYLLVAKDIQLQDSNFILVYSGVVNIYKNLKWLSRAFLAYRYKVVPDDNAALKIIRKKDFDGSVVIFETPPIRKMDFSGEDIKNSVNFLIVENNMIKIRVETEKWGYLVLADTYYPGWRVFVNGKKSEIMKANYIMRAVTVPPGINEVVFRFDPFSFKVGMWTSIITFFLCAIIITMHFIRRQYDKQKT
jgi:hypothetical protein